VGNVKKENLAVVEEVLGVGLKPALTGRSVELRGEVILYNDKKLGVEVPEIVVSSPNQVRVVEE
jgi:hypothetical protein